MTAIRVAVDCLPAKNPLPLRLVLGPQEQRRLRAQRGVPDARQVQQRFQRRALHPRVVLARLGIRNNS
jgi:hypothetical protein